MPEITHAFVSTVSDGLDETLVRPSNWNDGHITPLTDKGDLLATVSGGTLDSLAVGADGYVLVADSGESVGIRWAYAPVAIAFVIDGSGAAIETGSKGTLKIPFNCVITESELEADTSTSTTITIKKRSYGGGAASSIVASALPTLSSETESKDSSLSGWTTSIEAGDKLYWEVTSNDYATLITSTLTATRT